jgi:hypothetical protein
MDFVRVIIAGLSSMVWGYLWYGPLFGNAWMKATGKTRKEIESASKDKMPIQYGLTLVSSFVMAWVLSELINRTGETSLAGGLMLAFLTWVGFSAPTLLVHSLFEDRPWSLYVINASYHLAVMLTMGVILVLI